MSGWGWCSFRGCDRPAIRVAPGSLCDIHESIVAQIEASGSGQPDDDPCPFCAARRKHIDTPEAHARQRTIDDVTREQYTDYHHDRARGDYDDDPTPSEDER